ncbi:MAG: hypothetical protein L0Y72_00015 [Gemmataceae bacterium]|nr:hypothetical protein [Gemmataceae bacterium]MCI0737394.1 hypothetical protein [Gemmataceae bacterium]
MRPIMRIGTAAMFFLLLLAKAESADKAAKTPETCGEYGTTVQFEKTPSDAARKAQKEEKLVMVLHVSGDFEDPDFT